MRFFHRVSRVMLCGVLCLPSLHAAAQTYTPKQIRFDGGGDPAELLKLSGLVPGKPLTKEQIEAAMGKLADTGAFADLSYTVSGDALVIKLTGSAEAPGQALPVRYVNFVWWQPAELTQLVEGRVPLFHGQLPLTGTLTEQVRKALEQLLAEKGVPNAKVEAMTSTLGGASRGIGSLSLNITQPEIKLGSVTLSGAAPSTQKQLDVVTGKLGMQEFESDVTPREIRENVADTEKNAGYLDATVDSPAFSGPRKDMNGYAMDATATVHSGELYRLGALDFGNTASVTQAEAEKATELKPGLPAGQMVMEIGRGRLQRAYEQHGYLDTSVKLGTQLDSTAHTVALRFRVEAGELYHLAAVDTSALSPKLQAAFTHEFHGKQGMEAGLPLDTEIFRTLRAIGAPAGAVTELRRDRTQHTVTAVIMPGRSRPGVRPPVD